jgi:hypothetical protein
VLRAFGPDQVVEAWQLDTEDLAIEEEQCVEGLVLDGRRDSVANRECRQEGRDFCGAHLGGMALAMEEDVALDTVDIRLLGPTAVMACANCVTDAIEELDAAAGDPGRRRLSSSAATSSSCWRA